MPGNNNNTIHNLYSAHILLPNRKRSLVGLIRYRGDYIDGMIVLASLAPRTRQGLLRKFKGASDALVIRFTSPINAPEIQRINWRDENFIAGITQELEELKAYVGRADDVAYVISRQKLARILANFNEQWLFAVVQPEPEIVPLPDQFQDSPIQKTALIPKHPYITLNSIRVVVHD